MFRLGTTLTDKWIIFQIKHTPTQHTDTGTQLHTNYDKFINTDIFGLDQ